MGPSAFDVAQMLLEREHVAIIPGEGFGMPTHARLSFASNLESLEKGLDRIERFLTSR
jgi:aspartate aminotransferase